MKAFRKFLEFARDKETKLFFSWLVSYSLTVGGIVVLIQTIPVLGIITIVSYLWSLFALLNWMNK